MLVLIFLLLISSQEDLQRKADSYLSILDNMPVIKVRISDDLNTNHRMAGGMFPTITREIYFSKHYLEDASNEEVEEVIKADLLECWVQWKMLRVGLKAGESVGDKHPEYNEKRRLLGLNDTESWSIGGVVITGLVFFLSGVGFVAYIRKQKQRDKNFSIKEWFWESDGGAIILVGLVAFVVLIILGFSMPQSFDKEWGGIIGGSVLGGWLITLFASYKLGDKRVEKRKSERIKQEENERYRREQERLKILHQPVVQKAVIQTTSPPITSQPIKPEPVFVPPPLPIPEPRGRKAKGPSDDFFEELFKRKDPSIFHFIEHPHGEMAKQIMITLLPLFNIPCPGFKVSTRLSNDPSRNIIGCFSNPDIIIKASELDDGNYERIVDLIKHELIHAWQAYYGFYDEGSWRYFLGHDAFFFIKALEVDVMLDHCLKLYPYCRPAYEEVTEGQLKGLTPEQAWKKLFPGKNRKVINGPWI